MRERAPLDSPVKSTPLLDISDLVKRFPVKTPQGPGELLAVNRVSFQIYPGETIGLVGESGCGKSKGPALGGITSPCVVMMVITMEATCRLNCTLKLPSEEMNCFNV